MKQIADKRALKAALDKNKGDIVNALLEIGVDVDDSSMKWAKRLAKQWGFRKK